MSTISTRRPIYVIGPSIAYIPLTAGYFAVVDAQDADSLARYNWTVSNVRRRRVYAMRSGRAGEGTVVQMHRELMSPPFWMLVDHRSGHTLHNFRGNLRIVTKTQNNQNRRHFNSESGMKGAYMDGARRYWMSSIRANGKRIHLGRFGTKEEAHAAYCKAAAELHGEFAKFG